MKNVDMPLPTIPDYMKAETVVEATDHEVVKTSKMERKMQALRLAVSLERLHAKAHDKTCPEEEAVQAAIALGQICLNNFDVIVAALRVAGGGKDKL